MKKFIFIFLLILGTGSLSLYSQHIDFKGKIYDGIYFFPIEGVNIYNASNSSYQFTDKEGSFEIACNAGDTLIISKSIYRQLIVVMDQNLVSRKHEDFFLYYKAILLKEFNVIALNPSYEGFKRDLSKIEIPEIYKTIKGTEISDMDKANAEYKNSGPNLLKYAGAAAHPISALYSAFSKKEKIKRLYYEMMQYEDQIDQVPLKYNKEIVRDETNLPEEEIMDFMMFCHFSYYDLIRWTPMQIIQRIHEKHSDYLYYKLENNKKK